MNKKQKIFQEIVNFSNKQLSCRDHFVCVYGSYASGDSTLASDLDVFVAIGNHEVGDYKKVSNFLIDLQIRYGLSLDNEVPFKNKLLVSYEDVQDAIALKSFAQNGISYRVPIVEKKKEFLSSPEMRWRLILNALTSPNECVCGNKAVYTRSKINAEKSLIRLARGLTTAIEMPTIDEIFEVLTSGTNEEKGEMYLGYKKERKSVIKYLRELISRNYLLDVK
jgi:predicted nucleotidyltransferase